MEPVATSSNMKQGPCFQQRRDGRRQQGGLPIQPNTDWVLVPPPGALGKVGE